MKLVCWIIYAFLLIAFSDAFSQKSLMAVVDAGETTTASIHNITMVDKEIFLVDGHYKGPIVFGRDTLPNNSEPQAFVAQFKQESIARSMVCDGKIVNADQQFFCLVASNEDFTRETITKFNLNNEILWKYSLLLLDSFPGFVHVLDLTFDNEKNTYILFSVSTETGETKFSNEVFTGPATVILKLSSRGELVAFKKIPDKYNNLRIVNRKVCAYAFPGSVENSTCLLDLDLQEELRDEEVSDRLKYPLWDKKNYFRIVQDGRRPKRFFFIEKYNSEKRTHARIKVFQDTARFQNEIYQHEILDFDKREIVIVYVSRGLKSGNRYQNPQINILTMKKKSLEISQRIVINCDHLTPEQASDMSFKLHGKGLLIGSDYQAYCRIGNLSFVKKDNTKLPSFFVVKQPLK